MGDFSVRANAQSKFWSWFVVGLTFIAGASLIGIGIATREDESSVAAFVYGGLGIGAMIYVLFVIHGSQYVLYEDEGDQLVVRWGPGCCLNCTQYICCSWNCMDGKIKYSDIDNVKVLESTSCLDGCGVNHSKSRDVTYSTGCCVPAVEIQSTEARKHCCFSGRILLGVESTDQAQELILKINDKIGSNSIV